MGPGTAEQCCSLYIRLRFIYDLICGKGREKGEDDGERSWGRENSYVEEGKVEVGLLQYIIGLHPEPGEESFATGPS